MVILITGHRGYIGSALMAYLKDKPVVGYDIVDGDDILNYERLLSVMYEHKIRLVIHLAALSSVTACNEDPSLANKINGFGTEVILKAMRASNCRHIIYASTSSVYGNQDTLPYRESMETKPCSPYGESKLEGEKLIERYYQEGLIHGNYLIFRMFNVVGTSGVSDIDRQVSAGYDRLFAALESGTITIYGKDYPTNDGTGERDYVALKDVCEAYLLGIEVITRLTNIRRVVNIATGVPISVQTIINTWNDIADKECILPKLQYKYGNKRAGDPARVYGDNSQAKELLDWTPTRKIDVIISDLAIDKNLSYVGNS